MKKRKIVLMILVVMGIVVLSACSSGGDDGESKEGAQKKESSADLGQFADEEGESWRDSWSVETASGASLNINLGAVIEVPKLKQMSTVEVQRFAFNEENKKKLAEAIFGSEVYYHDEEHMLDFEIQELINDCQASLRNKESALQDLKENDEKEKTDEENIPWLEEGIEEDKGNMKRYEKLLKKAPKDYVKVEGDYKGNEYIGKKDGLQYLLTFDTVDPKEDKYSTGYCRILMGAYDRKDIYPDGIVGDYGTYNEDDIKLESENKCKATKEEAMKTAREFLQKAGFPDLILVEEYVMKWEDSETGEDDPPLIDGWQFTFSPGAEDAPFTDYIDFYDYSSGTTSTETEVIRDERFSPVCNIRIAVMDKGVVGLEMENPIMVLSSTPEVKLLPLEDIKAIIKNEIGGFAGFIQETKKISSISFNRLTLGYYRISDPEHEDLYTYVPAWRLWSNSGGDLSFVVNAMDGSVIEDWAEKRKVMSKEEWDAIK